MALALSRASPLKPEIRLAQAVSEFEAALSQTEKATLNDDRITAQNSPPTELDVLRLTAEIDRKASNMLSGGRCFGPRLTNVLLAVQRFVAIGDVVIGGSQNLPACGAWAVVRIALLVS
jgi:hypothetical protein